MEEQRIESVSVRTKQRLLKQLRETLTPEQLMMYDALFRSGPTPDAERVISELVTLILPIEQDDIADNDIETED